jgi:CO/xanthine dehydrogenase Mo-binding subunit
MQNDLSCRRAFLRELGYISVGFTLLGVSCQEEPGFPTASRTEYAGDLPGSLTRADKVSAWLEVLEDGRVRIFSGKVELGQGIQIAIQQVAAEELDMDLEKVEVHLAETGVTPNEGYTAGSASIKNSAMSVRYAAATARTTLLKLASEQMNIPVEELLLYNGEVKSRAGDQSITFSQLLRGTQIETEVTIPVPVKSKSDYKYVGKSIQRMDLQKMVSGEFIFIQDLQFPGMLHARVVHPPNYKSTLRSVDDSGLKNEIDGFIGTVVNGNFVAIIAEKEIQAIKAESYLREHCNWEVPQIFPKEELYDHIRHIADDPITVHDEGDVEAAFADQQIHKAIYTKPYVKHASMGPACAVALYDEEILHIWSNSQGIYPLREAIATLLQIEEDLIHIISVPGPGCFGHSTPDDAAAEAALIAMSYPGRHIRLQWSHSDDLAWDPYGSAIIAEVEACLDEAGKITAWKSDVWTDSHSTRPNRDGGTLMVARYLNDPLAMQSRGYLGGGYRNADPYYNIPNLQLNAHYFEGPLRVSSLRSLGAFANIFAVESFMDELAERAGKDPVDFRLEHLNDERAIAVVQKVQGLTKAIQLDAGEGIGYAFMRYKNSDAYIAVAAWLSVDEVNGTIDLKKMWAAIDAGVVINPDGLKNQTEGGMLQGVSWTFKEQVKFDKSHITSTDWSRYPVLRMADSPDLEVAIIDRPDLPAMGGGEAGVPPTAAAIANAIYRACGRRIYGLPITAERILG